MQPGPNADCPIVSAAGYSTCKCGWSDHPLNAAGCGAALAEDKADAAIREAIESGKDWRPKERFLASGPGQNPKTKREESNHGKA